MTTKPDADGRTEAGSHRVGVTTAWVHARVSQMMRDVKGSVRLSSGVNLWRGRPVSLAELYAYTRAGGWVPGDWPWYAELPGKAYGYALVLPLAALLYGAVWVLARPVRLCVVAVIVVLMALTL